MMRLHPGALAPMPMVLVVDDDDDIREAMSAALALDGYRVNNAPNGKIALEQAHVNRPDLIVLDLMMPIMSGWQFMEARRGDPGLSSIPVVVVTAATDSQVEGAAVLLQKPFDLDTLLTTVSRLCDADPKEKSPPSCASPATRRSSSSRVAMNLASSSPAHLRRHQAD